MQIDYLANWPGLIPELAALLHREWADLYQAAGIDQAQLQQVLTERTTVDTLPLTLVLVKDGELVGAGSIKLTEPGTKEGLSPWLAGIYVKPQYRGLGLGRDIVLALEAKAQQLGVETLYLSADSAVDFYLSLGWQVLERLESLGVRDVALMSKRFA
jgi:N-acetylglutamate synthase-like GNAT family acetyltransferase